MLDAHAHAFPERMLRAIYAWFDDVGWRIHKPPDAAAILDDLARLGCTRAVVLLYAHKAGIARGLNLWLRDFAASDPRVVPVGCVHPDDPDLADIVREALDDHGFAGIKLHCNVGRFRADDPRLDPLWEALRDRGRCAVVHAGTAPRHDEWVGLEAIADVAGRFPGLRIQLPHLGMAEWDLALDLVARHPIWLDTANTLDTLRAAATDTGPLLARFREAVLRFPDRILYGSDYPVVEAPLGLGVERLQELQLGAELTGKLLGRNALDGPLAGWAGLRAG